MKGRALFGTRIAVNAEDIYIDPSALACLYILQARSRALAQWRRRLKAPVGISHHGKAELVNAIALAVFRGDMPADDGESAFDEIEEDFVNGDLVLYDLLWRSALNRSIDLSKEHSAALGTRAMDVLHVACALELRIPRFLTFDGRQQQLAKAAGLKLISI